MWHLINNYLAPPRTHTFAVPATGAGDECMLSKSGRGASWSRARLQVATIPESMLHKDFLTRNGNLLNEEQEREREQRKERCRKAKRKQIPHPIFSESENEDGDDEEDPVLIKWKWSGGARREQVLLYCILYYMM